MLLSEVRKCPCSGLQAGKGGGVSKSWWPRWLVGPTGPESPCAAGNASRSAHFLPRAKTECLEAWGPGEIGMPGASPSQITSGECVCSGRTWLSIGTIQASRAPCQAPWTAPFRCPRTPHSGEADLTDCPPDRCPLLGLHLPEATNSHPHLCLSDTWVGPPSPSTAVPTFDPSSGP